MKVGFSSFVLQLGRTGISTYITNLIKVLQHVDSKNQYDILVPAGDAYFLPKLDHRFSARLSSSFCTHPIPAILWHSSVLPWLGKLRGYDIVHIPSYRRAPAIKSCKVVVTVHDLAPLSLPDKYDSARTFYHRHVIPYLLRRCDQIIAVSEHTKEDILRFTDVPEEKVSVVYSGIDRTVYCPQDSGRAHERILRKYGIADPFFLYVSRLEHPGKNHVGLIKAFEMFKKLHPSSHKLVLIGADWPGAEAIKRVAKASSVSDQIHFLGFIPTEDIVDFYSSSDLVVHPSFFEGFGFPVVEAAACGAQVICSNDSSLKELGDMGGLAMFDPNNPEQICEMMEKALAREFGEEERAKSIAFASRFDWESTGRDVLKVYERC